MLFLSPLQSSEANESERWSHFTASTLLEELRISVCQNQVRGTRMDRSTFFDLVEQLKSNRLAQALLTQVQWDLDLKLKWIRKDGSFIASYIHPSSRKEVTLVSPSCDPTKVPGVQASAGRSSPSEQCDSSRVGSLDGIEALEGGLREYIEDSLEPGEFIGETRCTGPGQRPHKTKPGVCIRTCDPGFTYSGNAYSSDIEEDRKNCKSCEELGYVWDDTVQDCVDQGECEGEEECKCKFPQEWVKGLGCRDRCTFGTIRDFESGNCHLDPEEACRVCDSLIDQMQTWEISGVPDWFTKEVECTAEEIINSSLDFQQEAISRLALTRSTCNEVVSRNPRIPLYESPCFEASHPKFHVWLRNNTTCKTGNRWVGEMDVPEPDQFIINR